MAKLTDPQRRMLALLHPEVPRRPGWLGREMWGDGNESLRTYARPACNVLYALRGKGLAHEENSPGWYGWVITEAGRGVLAEGDEA